MEWYEARSYDELYDRDREEADYWAAMDRADDDWEERE